MTTSVPRLLTSAEVAEMLRIKEHTLRAMRARNEGPEYIKLPSGGIRYTVEAVTAWIGGDR